MKKFADYLKEKGNINEIFGWGKKSKPVVSWGEEYLKGIPEEFVQRVVQSYGGSTLTPLEILESYFQGGNKAEKLINHIVKLYPQIKDYNSLMQFLQEDSTKHPGGVFNKLANDYGVRRLEPRMINQIIQKG